MLKEAGRRARLQGQTDTRGSGAVRACGGDGWCGDGSGGGGGDWVVTVVRAGLSMHFSAARAQAKRYCSPGQA
jgi:hypothetical protein